MNVASGSDAGHELRIGHRLRRVTLRRKIIDALIGRLLCHKRVLFPSEQPLSDTYSQHAVGPDNNEDGAQTQDHSTQDCAALFAR